MENSADSLSCDVDSFNSRESSSLSDKSSVGSLEPKKPLDIKNLRC